eukprot:8097804-Pyramimonas_sp.AAC.1
MVFGRYSRLCGCNSYVDSLCSSPRNGVLARFRIVKAQQPVRSVALESREHCFGMLQGLQT